VLDADLCVKAASKSFYTAFEVGPEQTLGKKLTDLGNGRWNIPALLTLLNELPKKDGEFDNFEMEQEFPLLGVGRCWSARDDYRVTTSKVE